MSAPAARSSQPLARSGQPLAGSAGPVTRPTSTWKPSPWLVGAEAPLATPLVPATTTEGRWRSRPVLSALVRALAFAIPVAASVAAAVALSRVLPRPGGGAAVVAWWAAVVACSTVVLMAVDRLARRLLPLAALLKLSMLFPDRAPDRFWVAFRAGTVGNLQQRLQEAREHGFADEPARAAARILTLVGALTAHDRRTRGHSERVRAFNELLAEEMHLTQYDRDRLRWAALLHDIGKLHTSPRILNKPDTPSIGEWEVLRRHPEDGARIIAPLRKWLGPWAVTVEEHHERWDGHGYPKGLAGDRISLGARIVAVADAFEVMTAPRPYRRPVSAEAARQELARCAGSYFDPTVVRAFLNISIGRLRKIIGPISWLAQLPFLGSVPRLEGAAASMGWQAVTTAGAATGLGIVTVSGAAAVGAVRPQPSAEAPAQPGAANQEHDRSGAGRHRGPGGAPAQVPGPDGTVPAPDGPKAKQEGKAKKDNQAHGRQSGQPEPGGRGRKPLVETPAGPGVGPVGVPPVETPGTDGRLPKPPKPPVDLPPINVPPPPKLPLP